MDLLAHDFARFARLFLLLPTLEKRLTNNTSQGERILTPYPFNLFPTMAHENTQLPLFSFLGYHNLRMNGLQNSSQTTHESAVHLPGWRNNQPTYTQSLLSPPTISFFTSRCCT